MVGAGLGGVHWGVVRGAWAARVERLAGTRLARGWVCAHGMAKTGRVADGGNTPVFWSMGRGVQVVRGSLVGSLGGPGVVTGTNPPPLSGRMTDRDSYEAARAALGG